MCLCPANAPVPDSRILQHAPFCLWSMFLWQASSLGGSQASINAHFWSPPRHQCLGCFCVSLSSYVSAAESAWSPLLVCVCRSRSLSLYCYLSLSFSLPFPLSCLSRSISFCLPVLSPFLISLPSTLSLSTSLWPPHFLAPTTLIRMVFAHYGPITQMRPAHSADKTKL